MRTSIRFVRPDIRLSEQSGISLIEVVFAMTLFLVVAAGVGTVLTSAIASHGLARERTLAQEHAQEQIEELRRLPYDQLGTTSGNPPGVVTATEPIAITGLVGTLNTQIKFVNDPTPNSYSSTAHYKRVTVTVRRDRDSKQLMRAVTYVAPPTGAPFGGITNAAINTSVTDVALNTPVSGATVDLATGPSAPRSDVTDATGLIAFTGLTANPTSGPQSFYDLSVTAPGYETLEEDKSPAAAARVQLDPGETFDTTIRVYQPVTINVTLKDSSGNPYTGPATVHVGSSRGAEAFPVSGGTLAVTQLGGEPLVPGLQYSVGARASLTSPTRELFSQALTKLVPDAYPTDLDTSYVLTLWQLPTSKLNVQVRNAGGTPIPGARVEVTGGLLPVFLTGLANTGGILDVDVPPGPGYTVTATGVNGEGTGQVTATAPLTGTLPVIVTVSSGGP